MGGGAPRVDCLIPLLSLSPVSMYVCLSSLFDYITWLQQHLNSLFLSENIEKYCKELKKNI